ncbi:hypothetical protein CD33_09620 [Ureibacillus sinduriensis BLB-1 = JCM 15800]|uniref:LSM domain-containing protein n=1 Tax=Ureibacillus sinduriensis BLB-1 = JCM 15800 TaxID=1384057 RepID=A0A0A3HZE5_9BACL|nr:hypothetical protein CD33_09620 [Ureibacillus sinduriensis BLB-1 = JCM 15800]
MFNQLRKLVNQDIKVAVGEELYSGELISVDNFVLRLRESTDTYEREFRNVVVLLSEVSFIQVPAN